MVCCTYLVCQSHVTPNDSTPTTTKTQYSNSLEFNHISAFLTNGTFSENVIEVEIISREYDDLGFLFFFLNERKNNIPPPWSKQYLLHTQTSNWKNMFFEKMSHFFSLDRSQAQLIDVSYFIFHLINDHKLANNMDRLIDSKNLKWWIIILFAKFSFFVRITKKNGILCFKRGIFRNNIFRLAI